MRKASLKIVPWLVLFAPMVAQAHSMEENTSFYGGFVHPISGMDHLLAMLGVGIVSVLIDRRWAVLWVPGAFVTSMVVGGLIGVQGVEFPHIELGIAISVLALGVAILSGRRFPIWLATVVVFLFGTFHGNAHGLEMPRAASPVFYSLGFVVTTVSIHVAGVGIGSIRPIKEKNRGWTSALGGAIGAFGVFFIVKAVI